MKKLSATLLALVMVGLLPACKGSREVKAPTENIWRMPLKSKITTLDPHLSNDVYSHQTQGLVYEPLFEYHYLKRPLQIVPALAEALPTISKDKKTFTIKMKKGVFFHDDPCFPGGKGREVTAEDVSYMIHRISAPKFNSPSYSAFENLVVGVDDYHAGKAPTISGVKVLDKYTIEVKLMKASPRFIFNFVNCHTGILPKEAVDKYGEEMARHAVGTGAWIIKEFIPASKVVAVRNPNYRKVTYPAEGMPGDKEKGLLEDAGKQVPFIDKIVLEPLTEDQPRWLKFLAGDYETVRIPKDNIGMALPGGKLSEDLAKRGVVLHQEVEGDVTAHIFNLEAPVWGEKKELRQATALALDVPALIERMYGGYATRAQSLIDPTQYGYDKDWKSKWSTRDVKKAKELVAKAGFPEGKGLPPLEVISPQSTTQRQINEMMAMQLKEAGILLKADYMTWPELDQKMRGKKFTSVGIGYASDMPDADTTFTQYHSRNAAPGANISNYKNPVVDKLIDEVSEMENGPARLKKIHQIRDILDDEIPMIPMVHRIGNPLVQPWVKNHVFTDELFFVSWLKFKKVIPSGAK